MIIDPAWWERADMRAALAVRDVGEVYRTLTNLGVSQRQIATLTGPRCRPASSPCTSRRCAT